MLITLTVSDYC